MQNFLNNSAKSIYIHIPFCIKKCNYCSFISYTNINNYEDDYTKALCKEIEAFKDDKVINTAYIGGGTPNLLKTSNLEKIISGLNKSFNFSSDVEFTMEFNPKISELGYIKHAKELGINRISIGAQSFNDKILKTLGRIHSAQDTLNLIKNIHNANILNYSLDLIYGIFGQNLTDLKSDLEIIKELRPKHISTYGLKIEKNTPFYNFPQNNLPDEDMCADMYLLISDTLRHAGYIHYEISNFAISGCHSKHNMTYWKGEEYYGFGIAAHGYLNSTRYKNTDNLNEYINNPLKKQVLSINTPKDFLEEKIFLGLRTCDGILLSEIKDIFGVDLLSQKRNFINQIIENKHAILDNERLYLTEKGFLISDYIISELIS